MPRARKRRRLPLIRLKKRARLLLRKTRKWPPPKRSSKRKRLRK